MSLLRANNQLIFSLTTKQLLAFCILIGRNVVLQDTICEQRMHCRNQLCVPLFRARLSRQARLYQDMIFQYTGQLEYNLAPSSYVNNRLVDRLDNDFSLS